MIYDQPGTNQVLEENEIYFNVYPGGGRCDYGWQVNPLDVDEMPFMAEQFMAQMFELDDCDQWDAGSWTGDGNPVITDFRHANGCWCNGKTGAWQK